MRECGLKFGNSLLRFSQKNRHSLCGSVDWNWKRGCVICNRNLSLPVRECGLKSNYRHSVYVQFPVTPCAGVWIEIATFSNIIDNTRSHSLCGSVDWNDVIDSNSFNFTGHSLCGSVDWNCMLVSIRHYQRCHSLCGSVDWNNHIPSIRQIRTLSLPVRECGLK